MHNLLGHTRSCFAAQMGSSAQCASSPEEKGGLQCRLAYTFLCRHKLLLARAKGATVHPLLGSVRPSKNNSFLCIANMRRHKWLPARGKGGSALSCAEPGLKASKERASAEGLVPSRPSLGTPPARPPRRTSAPPQGPKEGIFCNLEQQKVSVL